MRVCFVVCRSSQVYIYNALHSNHLEVCGLKVKRNKNWVNVKIVTLR